MYDRVPNAQMQVIKTYLLLSFINQLILKIGLSYLPGHWSLYLSKCQTFHQRSEMVFIWPSGICKYIEGQSLLPYHA